MLPATELPAALVPALGCALTSVAAGAASATAPAGPATAGRGRRTAVVVTEAGMAPVTGPGEGRAMYIETVTRK